MITAIFQTVLQLSLAGSLVAAVLLLMRALLGRRIPAHIQYALWGLLLIRLALPILPASPVSMFNLGRYAQTAGQGFSFSSQLSSQSVSGPTKINPAGNTKTASNFNKTTSVPSNAAVSSGPAANTETNTRRAALNIGWNWETVSLLWLVGVAAVLLYLISVNLLLRFRFFKWTYCTDARVSELFAKCKEELKIRTPVRILFSGAPQSPAVFGLLHPRILLSRKFAEEADDDTLRFVLLHELTHVKRKDNAVGAFLLLLTGINWFNPFLLYAFHKVREDCEISCDASVLGILGDGERKAYGYSILNTLQTASAHFVPGAAGFAGGFTKRRIVMLAKRKKISMPMVTLALVAALLAGCASLPGKSGHSSGEAGSSPSGSEPVSHIDTSGNLASSSVSVSTSSKSPVTTHSSQVSASPSGSTPETVPKAMQQALLTTDQQWENMLGGMDLIVGTYNLAERRSEGITFSNSKEISSELLFTFFCYVTSGDANGFGYPKNYDMKWYNKKDGKFYIPLTEFITLLNQYLGNMNFDPTQLQSGEFDAKTNCVIGHYAGFGGANAPVVTKKEQLSNDTLRITINYYDVSAYYDTPSKKILLNTKAYTMRYSGDSFQFVSIVKE